MKKTYKNPTLTVVKVQPAQFIANSLPTSGSSADPSLGMSGRGASFTVDWDQDGE